jgi:hypothetical protein
MQNPSILTELRQSHGTRLECEKDYIKNIAVVVKIIIVWILLASSSQLSICVPQTLNSIGEVRYEAGLQIMVSRVYISVRMSPVSVSLGGNHRQT